MFNFLLYTKMFYSDFFLFTFQSFQRMVTKNIKNICIHLSSHFNHSGDIISFAGEWFCKIQCFATFLRLHGCPQGMHLTGLWKSIDDTFQAGSFLWQSKAVSGSRNHHFYIPLQTPVQNEHEHSVNKHDTLN